MSVGKNYPLPVLFGGLAVAAAAVVTVLEHCLKIGDCVGDVIVSDAGSNPCHAPSDVAALINRICLILRTE